jgi:glutathione S-transferase/GST-like protein
MIQLYSFPTPNGQKVSIALEEMGLAYSYHPINILEGQQQAPDFLARSPNGRIPALVDGDVRVFESGAILQYLGRKSGKFYPADDAGRAWVDSWVHWQMAGLGPMTGQVNWFKRVAEDAARDPKDSAYALLRYTRELRRLYEVLERQLAGQDFICDAYSIADMASFPWITKYNSHVGGLVDFPNIGAWVTRLSVREAVQRGMKVGLDLLG